MATMLNVYDRQTRKKTAVLQNAFDIVETHELNQIYSLSFTLPSEDEKNKFCLPRHFVRWGDDGELYRIKAPKNDESSIGTITYECEHVVTTLCDTVMFGSFQYGGASVHTRATINWLLSQQKTQDWVLDVCEFDRKFEYLWEQENILNALYSIPKEFSTPYQWTFDTTVYPWKISLRVIDPTIKPEFYLRAKSNILSSGTSADYANICTRIYPLGYGEGVNQLNIKDVNGGVPYLQSPASIVAQYGIVEKVLVDRRFENAESLKAYAQTMLDLYQTPSMSRTFDVVDLYPLTSYDWSNAEVGKICKMSQDGSIAYITKTQWQRDKAGDLHIDLSTKPTDIASSVADLADRIRIESVYSQGATQLYQHSKDANATPQKGMVMSLYFPSEMRQINKVLMRLKLNKFRSYSQATNGGGASTVTSQGGGASTVTSQGGGASTVTSQGGGASTVTSQGGGATGTTSTSGGGNIDVELSGTVYDTSDPNWKTDTVTIYTTRINLSDWGNYRTRLTASENDVGDLYVDVLHGHDVSGSITVIEPDGTDHIHGHPFDLYADNWGDTERPVHGGGGHSHSIEDATGHRHSIEKEHLKHNHSVSINANRGGITGSAAWAHSHNFSLGNHTHDVSLPSHTHNVSLPSHTHNVSLPNHTHNVSLPNHTHTISAGIFESGNPSAFDIYVGNTKRATVNATSYDGDITTWLLNNKNQVPRDQWIDITIVPNDLAYVVCSCFVQGFVQSRGGGNY